MVLVTIVMLMHTDQHAERFELCIILGWCRDRRVSVLWHHRVCVCVCLSIRSSIYASLVVVGGYSGATMT